MDIKEIARVEIDDYIRIGNQHIFFQMSADDYLKYIDGIAAKKNQRIHIFELTPMTIPTIIKETINHVQDDAKVIIHIPRMVRDFARILNRELTDLPKMWKIVCEKGPVSFSYQGKFGKEKLYVAYSKNKYGYDMQVYLDKLSFRLPKHFYDSTGTGVFMTNAQWKEPELFKDRIIRNFKNHTPSGILSTFKSDDDIWEFLMEEYTNAKRNNRISSNDNMSAGDISDCKEDIE